MFRLYLIILFFITFSNAKETFVNSAAEISSALTTIQPGDTLTMVDGVWMDQQIRFEAVGTDQQPILLRTSNPGKTRLSGRSNLRISGQYLIVDGLYFVNGYSPSGAIIEFRGAKGEAQNCRLTNSAIENYNPPSSATDYKWISLYGKYNRVDHCYMRGKNHAGTTLVVWLNNDPDYHLIDYNYFAYRPDLGENGGETIRIGTSDWSMSDSYTIVENNYFEQCNGEIEIISNKSGHNTFRYNTFFECAGALTLRHGNYATVNGNFFLGNNKSNTGGIRVIGENHTVYNNYFQDLTGDGLRSALSVMNGVPDSPLNRYFQVINAHVLFNTFVNCKSNIVLGAGADSERTLPPRDCKIDNNVILTNSTNYIIDVEDTPINLTWQSNIFYGSALGMDQPEGISLMDPLLQEAEDDLWRPLEESPLLGQAVDTFDFVTTDMDGQSRSVSFDIGADQKSEQPVLIRPLTAGDAGPSWYPPAEEPVQVIYVQAGPDSLKNALSMAEAGDIIELTSDGGLYSNSSEILLDKEITIRAASDLNQRPLIQNSGESSAAIFRIVTGARLQLDSLILDGMAGTATPAKYLICTDDNPVENYSLFVNSCDFIDVVSGADGNFFRAYAGTMADSLVFRNCLFNNSGKEGIRLKDEAANSGLYNVAYFEMRNCTMWHTNKAAIDIYGGDQVIFTPGPRVRINHCTFYDCGYNQAAILNPDFVEDIKIYNSIFSAGAGSSPAMALTGLTAEIAYCDTINIGAVTVTDNAKIGAGMLRVDPLFADPQSGDFTLADLSPVRGKANDGTSMGDLRWSGEVTTVANDVNQPQQIVLYDNYPNPFNPSTTIKFSLAMVLPVKLTIHDITGKIVDAFYLGMLSAGTHTIRWQAGDMLASGLYFYRLEAGTYSRTKRMLLIR